ncbi:DUF6485 family protein [Thermanaeromonas sp. C210]|uniref:DUF6485 family protein n=1 Tax=Thermanaeromonas sp. C210 TaxID=2731925 RepID=UPI00155BDF48|nr:DUF6485 family protein [Thermanaeromonas sp. C210]GFN22496.1 hypothetical protein TAMC210_08120 [Thermanaeromonas sp. C210]
MGQCVNLEQNRKMCTCTYEPCSRKGNCCACILYHRRHGELPGCLFPPEVERTYDRSIERFVACYGRGSGKGR